MAEQTFRLLSLSFPTSVIAAFVNIGLSNAVFFVPRLVGNKLPSQVRRAVRFCTSGLTASMALGMVVWNWSQCGSLQMCHATPLDVDTGGGCLRAQSVTVVALLVWMFLERPVFAFAGIQSLHAPRMVESLGMALIWLFLSKRDPLSIPLTGVLLLRKTMHFAPYAGRFAVVLSSVNLLAVCLLAAGGECGTVSTQHAAGGSLVALLAATA